MTETQTRGPATVNHTENQKGESEHRPGARGSWVQVKTQKSEWWKTDRRGRFLPPLSGGGVGEGAEQPQHVQLMGAAEMCV